MDPQRFTIDQNDRLTAPENNNDKPGRVGGHRGMSPFIFGGGILVISLLLWGLWAWTAPRGEENGADLPIIRAPDGPIKMRAGGDGANQSLENKHMIYQKLESSESERGIEHLLDEPEEPQSRPPSLPDDFIGEMIGEGGILLHDDTPPAPQDRAVSAPKEPQGDKQTPIDPKGWMVHLGSLGTKDAADKEMRRLTGNARLKATLNAAGPHITAAKNSKTFLLKAGPLSKKEADRLCAQTQSERGSCLVRRR